MTELMKKVTLSDIGVLFARVEKLEAMLASIGGGVSPAETPAMTPEKPTVAVDVDAVMNELRVVVPALSSKDKPQAKAILACFGAQRVKDVKTEDLPDLLKAFKEAL